MLYLPDLLHSSFSKGIHIPTPLLRCRDHRPVRPLVHHLPFELSRSRGDDGTTAASLPCRKIIHSMRIILLHVTTRMIAKCGPRQYRMLSGVVPAGAAEGVRRSAL